MIIEKKINIDDYPKIFHVAKLAYNKANHHKQCARRVRVDHGTATALDGYRLHQAIGLEIDDGVYRVVKCTGSVVELLPEFDLNDKQIEWPDTDKITGSLETGVSLASDFVYDDNIHFFISKVIRAFDLYSNIDWLREACPNETTCTVFFCRKDKMLVVKAHSDETTSYVMTVIPNE